MKQILLMIVAVAVVGCGTPKWMDEMQANWDNKVASGAYTYDEAIKQMGPATQEQTLSDGSKVCVWKSSKFMAYQSGYAATINEVFQLTFSKTNRGSFGMSVDDNQNALTVRTVNTGRAADKAGIKAGDSFLKVNGRTVPPQPDLSTFKAGEKVKVLLLRGGKEKEVVVTLGQFPLVLTNWRWQRD